LNSCWMPLKPSFGLSNDAQSLMDQGWYDSLDQVMPW